MRALVTGAAGFVGGWLTRALRDEGTEVTALAMQPPDHGGEDAALVLPGTVQWRIGDLREDTYVADAVSGARPDVVVHLAAISHLPTAAADPSLAWDVNVTATARLLSNLDRLRSAGEIDPVVLIVGSAEQYGRQAHDGPIREDAPQEPRTVYAATKAAQETLAKQVWRASGLRVVLARSFNHSGRGQDPRFLLPAMVSRALALRTQPAGTPLRVGNTSPIRDFLHVSDVVAAYISLLRHGTPGEAYNVASGTGRSVQDIIEHVRARVGVEAPVEIDAALVRPVDVPALVGDPRKLMHTTGWRAQRAFDDIIDDLIHAATY